jgi:hypothetical protein
MGPIILGPAAAAKHFRVQCSATLTIARSRPLPARWVVGVDLADARGSRRESARRT